MSDVLQSDLHLQEHTGVLTHKLTQPTEDVILDRNVNLRNSPGAIRDLGQGSEGGTWGRQLASIPYIMYWKAILDGFELNAKNSEHAGQEMARFLKTPAGKSCLVQG